MKHIFVVNPHAGGRDQSTHIIGQVRAVLPEAEVYITRGPLDATRFVAGRCRQGGDGLRFYACGGDGTLNEVVSGVMDSGSTAAEVACLPCGSGNDYVKCWPGVDFTDIGALAAAPTTAVDVMSVRCPEQRWAVNVLNFGFEAEVCRTMEHVRRWPLVGGRAAYVTGIVHCLLHKRHTPCRLSVDGEAWYGGDMLLGSAASGRYVGGGYLCAPRAAVDDGWLEAQCIDSLGIPRFLRLIGPYRQGRHLDLVEAHDVVHHRRVHRMGLESDSELNVVIDGELVRGSRFDVEVMPRALQFVVPKQKETTH